MIAGGTVEPNLDYLEAYGQWRGNPVGIIRDFMSRDAMNGWGAGWAGYDQLPAGTMINLAIPGFPSRDDSPSLAKGAAGAYDAELDAIGRRIAASKRPNSDYVLAFMWESTANWFIWCWNLDGADKEQLLKDWVAYFRRFVTRVRAIAPGTRFSWPIAPGWSGKGPDPALAYPGDEYCDFIEIDKYDSHWTFYADLPTITDPALIASLRGQAWASYFNEARGLYFWMTFAAKHRKPIGFGEWCPAPLKGQLMRAKATTHVGGGDNAYFMNRMFWFMNLLHKQGLAGYDITFNTVAGDGDFRLFPRAAGYYDEASAEYVRLWSTLSKVAA